MYDNNKNRAAEWDVSSFLWSGRLRIVSIGGKKCYIKLEVWNSFIISFIYTKIMFTIFITLYILKYY